MRGGLTDAGSIPAASTKFPSKEIQYSPESRGNAGFLLYNHPLLFHRIYLHPGATLGATLVREPNSTCSCPQASGSNFAVVLPDTWGITPFWGTCERF